MLVLDGISQEKSGGSKSQADRRMAEIAAYYYAIQHARQEYFRTARYVFVVDDRVYTALIKEYGELKYVRAFREQDAKTLKAQSTSGSGELIYSVGLTEPEWRFRRYVAQVSFFGGAENVINIQVTLDFDGKRWRQTAVETVGMSCRRADPAMAAKKRTIRPSVKGIENSLAGRPFNGDLVRDDRFEQKRRSGRGQGYMLALRPARTDGRSQRFLISRQLRMRSHG